MKKYRKKMKKLYGINIEMRNEITRLNDSVSNLDVLKVGPRSEFLVRFNASLLAHLNLKNVSR